MHQRAKHLVFHLVSWYFQELQHVPEIFIETDLQVSINRVKPRGRDVVPWTTYNTEE